MRTLAIVEFVTLDGVMQGLGSPDEDRDGGFEHGGWGRPYGDHVLAAQAAAGMPATTAYLFGRRTYEKMAAHWPSVSAEDPVAASLNRTPKYVASRTLRQFAWAGTQRLDGDVGEAVRALKREGDGAITVLGSGELVQTLIAQRLIDEYRIFIHPLVLGTGKRLFREGREPLALSLADCTVTTTGVLLLSYRPA